MPKSGLPYCAVLIGVDLSQGVFADKVHRLFPGEFPSTAVVPIAEFIDGISLILPEP